jgi:hypothetical protein
MNTPRIHKATRVRVAALAVAALALLVPAGATVQAAGIRNCADVIGPSFGPVACYETIWANGVQHRMTFANQGFSGTINSKPDPFYVLAPQTATPQGTVPFAHDHVAGDVSTQNHGDYSVKLESYFVLCSAPGLISGACEPAWTSIPGFGTVPFAKTVGGQPLNTVERIESAAGAGLVTPIDLGAVIVGTISGN